jgi:hypothetical protein
MVFVLPSSKSLGGGHRALRVAQVPGGDILGMRALIGPNLTGK